MTTWLIIPVKSLRNGKTRLAPALGAAGRSAFMDRLLVHTLSQAALFPGLDHTLVVSGCVDTRARAAALGARTLEEMGNGLNAAVRQAQLAVRQWHATKTIVVACDLPIMDAEDLRRLAQAGTSNTVAIAPDRVGLGTNGLCLDAALDFAFAFGADSFRLHVAATQRLGLDHAVVKSHGLAFDIDTTNDLAEWERRDDDRRRAPPVTTA